MGNLRQDRADRFFYLQQSGNDLAQLLQYAIFGSILNLYTGFGEADPEKLKLIETLGGGKKEKLMKIILPSSVPLLLSVMKVNIGLCLVGVIIGEFIGARKGLGYLIIYSSQTFKLTWVLMSIIILCIIAIILYGLLGPAPLSGYYHVPTKAPDNVYIMNYSSPRLSTASVKSCIRSFISSIPTLIRIVSSYTPASSIASGVLWI